MCFFSVSEQAYWQLKDPFCTLKRYNDLQEELSKTNSSQRATRYEMILLPTGMGFFLRHMCFVILAECVSLEQNDSCSTLKTMSSGTYPFPNLTQFSKANHVLGASPSNTDDVVL
jgi:hypothetical protein